MSRGMFRSRLGLERAGEDSPDEVALERPADCSPDMTALSLGIDAGNSKTVALACPASGQVAGAGRSGCGDIYGTAGEQPLFVR